MALQCWTVLRAVGARAHHYVKHAAHHLGRHHVHRAGHWIAHHLVAPTALRVTVCTLAGLGAIGIAGTFVSGTNFHSVVPGNIGNPATLPSSSVPSTIGDPASAPITFDPSTIGGLPNPKSFDPSTIAGLSDPGQFAPSSEGDGSVDPSLWLDPSAGGLTDTPPSDPSNPDFSPGTAGRPAAIPEPASIAILATALLWLGISRRKLFVKPAAGEAK